MDPSELMTTRQVADLLHTTPGAIRNWRMYGTGPRGQRIGNRVLYLSTDVANWVHAKFGRSVQPPTDTPDADAIAAPRYFPWAAIAETAVEVVTEALDTTDHERNMVRNAVFDALPSAYDVYMTAIDAKGEHGAAEDEVVATMREVIATRLRSLREGRASARRPEAS